MATSADDRTEAPTPRRREKARSEGQVARSQDLPAAVILFASFVTIHFLGPHIWFSLLAILTTALTPENPTSLNGLLPYASAIMQEMLRQIGPFLLILFLVVLAALYAQIGWLLTAKPITPSLNKINPWNGIRRIFSATSIFKAVINIGKLLVVGLTAYLAVKAAAAAILFSSTLRFGDAFWLGSSLMFSLGMKLSVALLILALLDWIWQRREHEKNLRMTKEEVKDEYRSMEGDPKLKMRRREVQLQLAVQRMRRDVPTADVVVTNPTHLAVAIKYDADTMAAPKVVAKGADFLALRIRQIATEYQIPIVERKPLARELYTHVEVGAYIPERLYRAVAEILAYIYELSGKPGRRIESDLAGAGA